MRQVTAEIEKYALSKGKSIVKEERLGKKQLIKYRDLKKKLYYKHQKIQKFRGDRPG